MRMLRFPYFYIVFVLACSGLAAAALESAPKPLDAADRESFRVLQLESAEIQADIARARADLAEAQNRAMRNSLRRNSLGNVLREKYGANGWGLNRALEWVEQKAAGANTPAGGLKGK